MNKWLSLLSTIGPVILSIAVPGIPVTLIPVIIHAVATAQATALTGADKKVNVLAVVSDAITVTNQVAKKQIVDPAVISIVSGGIDTVVQSINAIHSNS